jgi:RimJ/RimL family protein N-acetyltransferase
MEAPPERIQTARLLLRRWTVDDAKVLVEAANASLDHLRPWMPWVSHVRTPAEQRQWLEHITATAREGSEFAYGVFRATDPTSVIGGCGLHRRIGAGGIEIGYWIHVDAIGNGYATELAGALTRVALQLTGIDRVEIHCDQANVRSAAVPRKLGYVLDRIDNDDIEAPAETGRSMIWVMQTAQAAQTSDRPVTHRCRSR